MDEELTALAGAGAAALVAAMATDLWQDTKGAVVGLFRRAGRSRRATVEAQLDNNAGLVRAAVAPAEVQRALLGLWTLELGSLLRQSPSCREPLACLVRDVRGSLPDDDRRAFVVEHLEQTNTARDSGTVFAVQSGDQPGYGRGAESRNDIG